MPDDPRATTAIAVQALAPDGADPLELLADIALAQAEAEADVPERTEREPWAIRTDDDAEWALNVLASAEAQRDAVIAHAEAIKRRAEEWADGILNERRHNGERSLPSTLETIRLMRAHLEWYGRRQRDEKRATVSLMGGTISTAKVPAKVVVTDDAAVLEWAKANDPAMVKVTEEVQVSALRKRVKIADAEAGKLRLTDPAEEDPRPDVVVDSLPGVGVEPEGVRVTVNARLV